MQIALISRGSAIDNRGAFNLFLISRKFSFCHRCMVAAFYRLRKNPVYHTVLCKIRINTKAQSSHPARQGSTFGIPVIG